MVCRTRESLLPFGRRPDGPDRAPPEAGRACLRRGPLRADGVHGALLEFRRGAEQAGVAAPLDSDEVHVADVRHLYRRKRETLLPALERKGLRHAGGSASFFLWIAVEEPSEAFARTLLDHGILTAPGSFFGPAGEGYVRFALVPTQEECERAAAILERVL